MKELHFLSDEEKIIRLDNALDKAIDILMSDGYDCPMAATCCGECVYPEKWKTCEVSDEGYDCWRWYLTH